MMQESEVAAARPCPFEAAAPAADLATVRNGGEAPARSRRADLEAMAFGDAVMPATRAPRADAAAHEAAHVIQQRQGAIFAGQYN